LATPSLMPDGVLGDFGGRPLGRLATPSLMAEGVLGDFEGRPLFFDTDCPCWCTKSEKQTYDEHCINKMQHDTYIREIFL
jgi:hypothetical protein